MDLITDCAQDYLNSVAGELNTKHTQENGFKQQHLNKSNQTRINNKIRFMVNSTQHKIN